MELNKIIKKKLSKKNMKFILDSSELYKHLSAINGVIPNNPVVPIIENFLFTIKKGTLNITATDMHLTMIKEIAVECRDGNECEVAIPAKILLDTLKNSLGQELVFTVESEKITITSKNGSYQIGCEDAKGYPTSPSFSKGFEKTVPTDVLKKGIKNTILAVSNDELRPAMTGVFFKFEKSGSAFVATDGHVLLRYQRKDVVTDNEFSMIIPQKALKLLKSSLPNNISNVEVKSDGSNAFFEFGNLKMICRLIDEKFPPYENVIPNENENKVIVSTHDIIPSLRRILVYSDRDTHHIKLGINGDELLISARDIKFSKEAIEKITSEHIGEDIEIGFNAKVLLNMIGNLSTNEITISLNNPKIAAIIQPTNKEDENEDIMVLAMPVSII